MTHPDRAALMREAAAKVAREYTKLSSLHNYGPAGPSREEKAEMRIAKFIEEDILRLPLPPPTDDERVQHVKRGTTYTVVGEFELQSHRPVYEEDILTAYRSEANGKGWCRPTEQFRDGRFVTLTEPRPPTDDASKLAMAVEAMKEIVNSCYDYAGCSYEQIGTKIRNSLVEAKIALAALGEG